MMVGQWLYTDGALSISSLLAALSAVILIRENDLDKEKAAQGLRYAQQKEVRRASAFRTGILHPSGCKNHPHRRVIRNGRIAH